MMPRESSTPRPDRANAAPSSASDISLYGATPIALGIPAIAMTMGGAPATAAQTTGADAPASPPSSGGNALLADGGSPFVAALVAPIMMADTAMASLATLTATPPEPIEAAAEPPAQPPVLSGGSGTPPGMLPPPASVPTEMAPGALGSASEPTMAMPPAEASRVAQSMQADADAAMEAVGERIDAMDDIVAGLDQRVEAIGAELAETVGGVVADTQDRIADIGGALNDTLAGITTTVDARIADTTGALDDAVGDVLTTVSDRVDDTGDVLGDALSSLADIGGSDPAAGITTLVSMVSAADVFGLHDIGGGSSALALSGIGGDLPGDFAPADILLSVPDPHDGALGLLAGLTDDWGSA